MIAEAAQPTVPSQWTPILAKIAGWLPPAAIDLPAKRPFLFLCLRTGALLGIFILAERLIMGATRLPAASYEKPYLVLGVMERLGIFKIVAMAMLAIVLTRFGALLGRWSALDFGRQLRWFVVFLALIMAWPFTTYGYNLYFDQGYYTDRALIAILVPLIWFRPVFIYPFLFIVFASMWQLVEPSLGGTVLAHKLQVLHVLNLFAAAFLIHATTGSRRMDIFFFLTCCLVAAAYWEPALAKLKMNWIAHGHLYRMPLAAYAHGWLTFLDPSAIVAFAKALSWFDWPMRLSVLAIEAGCLLFLWRRSVSIGLLAAVMVFHLGVFALYGFLFWTWILLDAALLALLVRDWRARKIGIYSRGHLLLSVLLIGFASLWANPSPLGWFDTRLTYTYRLEGIGLSGKRFPLPPRFFAPYEDAFTMTGFDYLAKDHGVLVGAYGVTMSREVADAIAGPTSRDEIFALESKIAPRRYDAARAARFYEFVTRYVGNWNIRHGKGAALYALRPPPQFWSFRRGEIPPSDETIREVIVTEVTTLFDDEHLTVIRELELARLEIPGKPAR